MQATFMSPYVLLIYLACPVKFLILIFIHIFILCLKYEMYAGVLSILI